MILQSFLEPQQQPWLEPQQCWADSGSFISEHAVTPCNLPMVGRHGLCQKHLREIIG